MSIKKLNYRYEYILVWNIGLKFLHDILDILSEERDIKIVRVVKHRPKSIKKLVKYIYSYDYAPYWHLREKTKYLMTKGDSEVCFIFMANHSNSNQYYGDQGFRHIESVLIKDLKNVLRERFNERKNDIITANHVIHASDNPSQVDHILRYLGNEGGMKDIDNDHPLNLTPSFLKFKSKVIIKKIDLSLAMATYIEGKSWCSYSTKQVPLRQMPHFHFVNGEESAYISYTKKFIGGPITTMQSGYCFRKMIIHAEKSDCWPFPRIVVKNLGSSYQIIDGVHRASIQAAKGKRKISVCVI